VSSTAHAPSSDTALMLQETPTKAGDISSLNDSTLRDRSTIRDLPDRVTENGGRAEAAFAAEAFGTTLLHNERAVRSTITAVNESSVRIQSAAASNFIALTAPHAAR